VEKLSKNESASWVFAKVKGNLRPCISQLRRISAIKSVSPVTGRFDLVIRLRTNEPSQTLNAIEEIRRVKGVASTQTAISLRNVSSSERSSRSEQPLAYTLVKVRGALGSVLQKVRSFPNLVEAHIIPGEFDLVASFRGRDQDEVMETSVERVNNISGVSASETLMSWSPSAPTD
jgi:DNA-binding Lrp family transcriptional regulator